MKSLRNEAKPRRALLMLLGGLLATLIVLGLAQWTTAQDKEPDGLIPDSSSIYADRMPTEREASKIESPVERYLALETISGDQLVGSDLSTSNKSVNKDQAPAGSDVQFTIVISNTGDTEVAVVMTDTLPAGLSYVSHERVEIVGSPGVPEFTVNGDEIIWQGSLGASGHAEIAIKAAIGESVLAGTMITNTSVISGSGQIVSPAVKITVLEKVDVPGMFMPSIFRQLDRVMNLAATRPNSQNRFTLSWPAVPGATQYQVQQANDPGFSSPVQYNTGSNPSLEVQLTPSWRNNFYFRARAIAGTEAGLWSDPVNVVGAYRDDFNDPASDWRLRRKTNIEKVNSWYEFPPNYGHHIIEVGDKWDWGIASPLARAPQPPYVIEFVAKFAQTPNEVSMGIVFGGDYPNPSLGCPDYASGADGVYRHTRCLNHFYNPQWYWAGEKLHFLWYRTDDLVWCPSCSGSPMKRRGDSENIGQMRDVKDDEYNLHRVEVRSGSIKYYAGWVGNANPTLQYEYNDTRYINEPYFGTFAYAGEYTSSVAKFDYFAITPLDN